MPFAPIGDGPIGLYVCGVTPYDTGHLGHAFTYLSFDVLHRYLEYLGHTVVYVQNLTDVDDDMLKRARQWGSTTWSWATVTSPPSSPRWQPSTGCAGPLPARHRAHRPDAGADREAAGARPRLPGRRPRLLRHRHVARLRGASALPREAMLPIANERGNVPDLPGKRNPLDFVLWQPSARDEPSWPSPWAPGDLGGTSSARP